MDLEEGQGHRPRRAPARAPSGATGALPHAGLAGHAALLSVPPVLGRLILGTCIAFLILGVLPASFVFWLCLMLLAFTCLRIRLQAQQLQQALEQTQEEQAVANLAGSLAAGGRLQLGGGGGGGAFVRLIPGGGGLLLLHTDPRAAIERINMQLRALDEEVGVAGVAADYDALLRLGRTGPLHPAAILHGAGLARSAAATAARPPLSDEDIASLPSFPYKAPRANSNSNSSALDAAVTSGPHQHQQQHQPPHQPQQPQPHLAPASLYPEQPSGGAAAGASLWRTGSGQSPRHLGSQQHAHQQQHPAAAAAAAAAAGAPSGGVAANAPAQTSAPGGAGGGADGVHEGLTCSVCLDSVADGQMVTTLPCLHQFHSACINPWLRHKGLHASCPLCKTPVFR